MEAYERLIPPITHELVPPPFLAPNQSFCMCSQEVLLDLKNEKYVVSLSFIWAGPTSSLPLPLSYLGVSAHRRETPTQPGTSMLLNILITSCSKTSSFSSKLHATTETGLDRAQPLDEWYSPRTCINWLEQLSSRLWSTQSKTLV